MKILLILSLIANLALAGIWLAHKPTGPATPSASQPVSSKAVTVAPTAAPAITRRPEYGGMNWTDIQTDDLRELIKRLRAAGCPEETVQDIVLADVNRRYAARLQKAFPDELANKPYWQVENPDPAAQKERNEQWKKYSRENQDLMEEKSSLLVKLLGVDPEKERREAEGLPTTSAGWAVAQVYFLPESKQVAAAKYLEDFNNRMQDFYARSANGWDADTRAEKTRLEQEKIKGLAEILAPAEIREYQLRQSDTASQTMSLLRGVSVTRGGYEAVFDIRQKYGDSVMMWSDLSDDPTKRAQVEENQRAMKADIAFALGADKAAEIERANDYTYQQLDSYTKHYQLPPDTAAKVYAYKQTAETSAARIKADGGLEPQEQAAALQKIRAETENAVKTALGDKAYKRYQQRGGWWIQNLNGGRRS